MGWGVIAPFYFLEEFVNMGELNMGEFTHEATQAWNFLWEMILNLRFYFFNRYSRAIQITYFLSELW